jgi:hypothetical protein
VAGYRDLNGSSDLITLANESNFDFERTQAHTACMWHYMENTSAAAGSKILFSKNLAADGKGWHLASRPGAVAGRVLRANIRNGIGNQILRQTDADVSINAWHCLGYTYSGSSAASGVLIYVDGSSVSCWSPEDTLSASILHDDPVVIGASQGGSFADCRNAYFAVWNIVLSGAEMSTFNGGGDVPQQDNLICFLRMDAQQSPEPDDVGSNDGTLTGTTSSATGGPSVTYNALAGGASQRFMWTP